MPTAEDYKQMADRSAQLALQCATPSVAEALMALALDYMKRAASLSDSAPATPQQATRATHDGFGD